MIHQEEAEDLAILERKGAMIRYGMFCVHEEGVEVANQIQDGMRNLIHRNGVVFDSNDVHQNVLISHIGKRRVRF